MIIFLLKILLFLSIVFAYGIFNSELISAYSGESVFELEGWTTNPKLVNNLNDFPFYVIFFIKIKLYILFYF